MSAEPKKKYTGIVRKEIYAKGSKSEHAAVVLDTGAERPLKLCIRGNNPFDDPALEPFVGLRVSVEGTASAHTGHLFVETAADIVVLGPPGRPSRPAGPRP